MFTNGGSGDPFGDRNAVITSVAGDSGRGSCEAARAKSAESVPNGIADETKLAATETGINFESSCAVLRSVGDQRNE